MSQLKIATENGKIYRDFMEKSEKRQNETAEAINEIKNEVEVKVRVEVKERNDGKGVKFLEPSKFFE